MFKNMKVGLRLTLGFSAVLLLMGSMIGASLYQETVSHEKLERVVKINNVRGQLANNMIDDARKMTITVRDLLLATQTMNATSEKIILEGRDQIAKLMKDYVEAASSVKELITKDDSEGIDKFNHMEVSGVFARQAEDQLIELIVAGKHQEAIDFLNAKSYPAMKQWIGEVVDFIRHNEARTEARFNQAVEAARFVRTIIFTLGAAALALSMGIIIFLTLGITKPLNLCIHAADKIASGDLTMDLSTPEKREDELGFLIESFKKMVATLRDVTDQADNISKGDYSANVEPRSDKDNLGIALQRMNRALRENWMHMEGQNWLKTGIVRLNEAMSGDPNLTTLASKVISEVSTYLNAQVGALYVVREEKGNTLTLMGSYAFPGSRDLSNVSHKTTTGPMGLSLQSEPKGLYQK